MRRTKILATYGPSIDNVSVLRKLMKKVDMIRINFSHGNEQAALTYMDKISLAAKKEGIKMPLMADLPGPKIRLGKIPEPITLKKGDSLSIEYGPKPTSGSLPTNYENLYKDAREGAYIMIGDGILRMRIDRIANKKVYCTTLGSGTISSGKGINLQGASVSAHVPTKRDMELAKFAAKEKFDYIAITFVKSEDSLHEVRKAIGDCFLVSKIERKEALGNIDSIVGASDGIMVARGDLALDIPIEQIPIAQRFLVNAARAQWKPVIVATQALVSMTSNPMPTRAEVNDVSNSVMEGADCLMLSEETSVGAYPLNVVDVMEKTIIETEKFMNEESVGRLKSDPDMRIAFAAGEIANEYDVDCIFTPTITGKTTKRISALRPNARIIALCDSETIGKRLTFFYGVEVHYIKRYKTIDDMFDLVAGIAKKVGAKRYLIVFGTPNRAGSTDTIKYVNAES